MTEETESDSEFPHITTLNLNVHSVSSSAITELETLLDLLD